MMNIHIFYLIILIFITIITIISYQLWCRLTKTSYENYDSMTIDNDYDPYMTHTNFPFSNYMIGTKRGMSYDLRGDISILNRVWMPFNMSTTIPIVNKPLYTIS